MTSTAKRQLGSFTFHAVADCLAGISKNLILPTHLGWPHRAWLSFTELDKAMVHVIRLSSFLRVWFQCLPSDALSQHLLSYLGFSYLGRRVSSWLLQQSAAIAPYLGRGIYPHAAPPDLEHGVAPLGPPAPMQLPLLGRGENTFSKQERPRGTTPHPWSEEAAGWSYPMSEVRDGGSGCSLLKLP